MKNDSTWKWWKDITTEIVYEIDFDTSEGMSLINSNENLMKITEQEYRSMKNKVCRECWKEIKQDQYGNSMGLEDEKDYWICDECIDEEIL